MKDDREQRTDGLCSALLYVFLALKLPGEKPLWRLFRAVLFKEPEEILGQIAGERDSLSGSGVRKAKLPCMQALALKARLRLLSAVDRVAEDGVTYARHVDADLVGPARLQAAAQVRHTGEARENLVMCNRGL